MVDHIAIKDLPVNHLPRDDRIDGLIIGDARAKQRDNPERRAQREQRGSSTQRR